MNANELWLLVLASPLFLVIVMLFRQRNQLLRELEIERHLRRNFWSPDAKGSGVPGDVGEDEHLGI